MIQRKQLLRLTLFVLPVSITIGLLVALFLWLLDIVTVTRWENGWLLFFLPLAGILITGLYKKAGKNADAGTSLIIDEIHDPVNRVPARLTPLIFFSTILTHLFGGSAGREGTAVQMGGSLSAFLGKWYQPDQEEKKILLMCGMSAGFGAVFGTPVAGAIFALEVIATGKIKYEALLPCLIAGMLADTTCALCGIHHTQYHIGSINFDFSLLLKVAVTGILFGLTGLLFTKTSHLIKTKSSQLIRIQWLIPVVGSGFIIGISYLLNTFDYLGLSVTNPNTDGISIVSAFHAGGADTFSWLWKLLLTAITLGMGFKGGEVTPLFFIGAALGNTLAIISSAPVDLFAGLGFIAVFAAATKTPLASTILGIELFGCEHVVFYTVACFTAWYISKSTSLPVTINGPAIKHNRKKTDDQ